MEGRLIAKLTPSPSDPQWAFELKRKLNEIIGAVNAAATRGDGTTTRVEQGTISAIPAFYPCKITGAKDGNGYYEGSVYLDGAAGASPLTGELILLVDRDIDHTDTQGWYWCHPSGRTVGSTYTRIWEVVCSHPKPTDTTNNYVLGSLAGVEQWLPLGPCTTTAP